MFGPFDSDLGSDDLLNDMFMYSVVTGDDILGVNEHESDSLYEKDDYGDFDCDDCDF